jgi:hypothetical protein
MWAAFSLFIAGQRAVADPKSKLIHDDCDVIRILAGGGRQWLQVSKVCWNNRRTLSTAVLSLNASKFGVHRNVGSGWVVMAVYCILKTIY